MYQRLMRESIGPLLHGRGMTITANKPVTVASTSGVDGIMMMEDAPKEESPAWITGQSYLGLTRHVMILDGNANNAEMMYLHCLRYGAFPSYSEDRGEKGRLLTEQEKSRQRELEGKYLPYISMFQGKKWIFYPEALTLPENSFGNIFRLKDGSVMITMISAWRVLRDAEGFSSNLEVIARLPDAALFRNADIISVDGGERVNEPTRVDGDRITIKVPRHGKATVILLKPSASASN